MLRTSITKTEEEKTNLVCSLFGIYYYYFLKPSFLMSELPCSKPSSACWQLSAFKSSNFNPIYSNNSICDWAWMLLELDKVTPSSCSSTVSWKELLSLVYGHKYIFFPLLPNLTILNPILFSSNSSCKFKVFSIIQKNLCPLSQTSPCN
jgi:hypothetical protein